MHRGKNGYLLHNFESLCLRVLSWTWAFGGLVLQLTLQVLNLKPRALAGVEAVAVVRARRPVMASCGVFEFGAPTVTLHPESTTPARRPIVWGGCWGAPRHGCHDVVSCACAFRRLQGQTPSIRV